MRLSLSRLYFAALVCCCVSAAVDLTTSSIGLPKSFLIGVARVLLLPVDGDLILLGSTNEQGLQTIGPAIHPGKFACFVSRVTASGTVRYFRYFEMVNNCSEAAISANWRHLWIRAWAVEPEGDAAIRPDHDLFPQGYNSSPAFLFRIEPDTGELLSTTRYPANWSFGPSVSRVAVDSRGAVWIGGYARGPVFTTPDAFEVIPFPYVASSSVPGFLPSGPATLMRLSPDGDRIEYATTLRGLAVGAVVLDENDNVYAVGPTIWKFSPKGEILWSAPAPGSSITAAYHPQGGLVVGGCFEYNGFISPTAFQPTSEDVRAVLPSAYYPSRCIDGFVARYSADGDLIYSTLLSSPARDSVNSVTVDASGSAVAVVGMGDYPSKQKDILWAQDASVITQEYLVKLNPEGTDVAYFTPFNKGAAGAPLVLNEDGSVLAVRSVTRRVNATDLETSLQLLAIRETDPVFPRIDRAIASGNRTAGYRLEIRGEGFGDDAVVELDGVPIAVAARSSPGVIQTVLFPAMPRSESGFWFPFGDVAAYRLVVKNKDGSESRAVEVSLQYPLN